MPQGEENHIVLDYKEEFTEFMKFRIHRLEHKAHSFLQHIPDDIHQKAWKKQMNMQEKNMEKTIKKLKVILIIMQDMTFI